MCHVNLPPDLWELPFLADYTVASMQAEQVLGCGLLARRPHWSL